MAERKLTDSKFASIQRPKITEHGQQISLGDRYLGNCLAGVKLAIDLGDRPIDSFKQQALVAGGLF